MRSAQGAVLFLAPLLVTTGCVRQVLTNEVEPDSERTVDDSRPAIVRNIEVAYDGDDDDDESSAPVPAASAGNRAPPEPVLFSLGAGHGTLGQVDLHPCRDQGLQAGYLHMRVTFRHSGRIVRAAVECPEEPSPEALTCIGEQLETALVPVFDGDDVTLSKSFFVN